LTALSQNLARGGGGRKGGETEGGRQQDAPEVENRIMRAAQGSWREKIIQRSEKR